LYLEKRMITFCEAYAGTGAVTLSLFDLQPYPLRTGHKAKIAKIITEKMGITKYNVGKIVFCELDPHVRLLLKSYTDRELYSVTKDTLLSYVDMANSDPFGLWSQCRDIVKQERASGILDEYSLANWFVFSVWNVMKGCYVSWYCGPGTLTKSGRTDLHIKFENAVNKFEFKDLKCDVEILRSCSIAYGDIIYLDPPYNLEKNDQMYGSFHFGENQNVSTACELAERLKENSKVYLSTSEQIYTGQKPIALQSRAGKERTEWFGIVD